MYKGLGFFKIRVRKICLLANGKVNFQVVFVGGLLDFTLCLIDGGYYSVIYLSNRGKFELGAEREHWLLHLTLPC